MTHSVEQFASAGERAAKALLDHTFDALRKPAPEPQRSNWTPLVELVGEKCAQDFMFMGDAENLNLYKHVNTRRYLNIDRTTFQTYKFVPAMTLDEAVAGAAHYEVQPVQEAIAYALSH